MNLDDQRGKRPGNHDRTAQFDSDDSQDLNQSDRSDLRTRIIAAIAKADQDWCSDGNLYEDMAGAVIRELHLSLGDEAAVGWPVKGMLWKADK
jgi:hypothetical protein